MARRTTAPAIVRTQDALIVKGSEVSLTRASDIVREFASQWYNRKTIEFAGAVLKFAPSRESLVTPVGSSVSHPKFRGDTRVNLAGVVMDASALITLVHPNATAGRINEALRGVSGVKVVMES